MKICILTQPLKYNYGGILQAYALQRVLKDLGHEPQTANVHRHKVQSSRGKLLLSRIKRILIRLLYRKFKILLKWGGTNPFDILHINTHNFIRKYIKITEIIDTEEKFQLLNKYNYEAYIVGSDQVWRPRYTDFLTKYFLEFITDDSVKKIAYAASFGVDEWEFTEEQTEICSSLAKKFDAISLREDSGVMLCKKYLGVEAEHLIDPTLLLQKEDYIKDLDLKETVEPKYLATYILDESDLKNNLIKNVSIQFNIPVKYLMPLNFNVVGEKYLEECIFPPVEEWIEGIKNSDFVITDSYHGTIFSILFEKEFYCIANKKRGITRLQSLLNKFHLTDRLILNDSNVDVNSLKSIDYKKVNDKIEIEREKAIKFLTNSLIQHL